MDTLRYYYARKTRIEFVEFNNYTITEDGVILNKKTGDIVRTRKTKAGYNVVGVYDNDKKQRRIYIGRALASIRGPPPTPHHTADHIDRDPNNDTLDNIRWSSKKEQIDNRNTNDTQRSAYIIVNNGEEKTAKEWVDYLKDKKNPFGRDYTEVMFNHYAQKNQHGFSYKEYPDLEGEIWKEIDDSATTRGRWKISNMSRVKCITNCAENVLERERLGLMNGYPMIRINKKIWKCHILAFKTFYPEEWRNKKMNEFVLHQDDDILDFRPGKLRLGTKSDNGFDAHSNGCYDEKKSARQKCVSYIDGKIEKEHNSQHDAMRYLKSVGYDKVTVSSIGHVLSEYRGRKTAYGRTWKNFT